MSQVEYYLSCFSWTRIGSPQSIRGCVRVSWWPPSSFCVKLDEEGRALGMMSHGEMVQPASLRVISGCLELVRYKLKAIATSAAQWIHFRSDAPIWQPN